VELGTGNKRKYGFWIECAGFVVYFHIEMAAPRHNLVGSKMILKGVRIAKGAQVLSDTKYLMTYDTERCKDCKGSPGT